MSVRQVPGLTLNSIPDVPGPQFTMPGAQMTVMHHDPYSAAAKPLVGQVPTLGKGYPADFTKLYNSFAAAYAQHPADVANERASGGGPWTSRMRQLDDLKDTQDWTRTDAPRLKRLPLGVQQNIYNTPDAPEGQVNPSPPNYGEDFSKEQASPQADDVRRLFGNQIGNGFVGSGSPFAPMGGWGI